MRGFFEKKKKCWAEFFEVQGVFAKIRCGKKRGKRQMKIKVSL